MSRQEDPAAPAGTLEWTLPSGVTCRSHPHIADPGPIPTSGAAAHPEVVAAAVHLAERHARDEAWQVERATMRSPIEDLIATTDWAGEGWRRSRDGAARARAEEAARDAQREAEANKPPPF